MKALNILFTTTIIILFVGCGRIKKEYYKTGELKAEFQKDENGLRQGEVIKYYKNGNIESRGYYLNDTINGKFEEYYPNGTLKVVSMIIKGKQEGEYIKYYENGKVDSKGTYVNGIENGLFQFYYQNGILKMEAPQKNGMPLYFIEYDSLGNKTNKKHTMYLEILGSLTKHDSIKIKERIPGFIADNRNPMFALIEKYGTIKEGDVPKMKFNTTDSCYYISFPPVKDTGRYVIKTFFRADNKFHNENDTIITIR